jgi:hypothetical protein
MQERYIRPNEDKDNSRSDESECIELDVGEVLLLWIEIALENPKNKEIIRKIREQEYNKTNGE